MSGGAILAIIGSLIALLGSNLGAGSGEGPSLWRQFFSAAYSEELGYRGVALLQTWPGQISAVLAVASLASAAWVLRKRQQKLGWLLLVTGALQLGLAGLLWRGIYGAVPCEALGLPQCDPGGGLIPETYLHMSGLVWLVLGGALGVLGGAGVLAALTEYPAERRFLRVALHWGEQVVAERVLFTPQPVTVGEAAGNLLQVPAGGLDSHILLTPLQGDAYQLVLPFGAQAKVEQGGQPVEFEGVVAVHDGYRGAVRFDNGLELRFDFTAAQQGALAGGRQRRDEALGLSFALVFSACVIGFVVLATAQRDPDDDAAREALLNKNRGFIEVAIEEPKVPEVPKLEPIEPRQSEPKAEGEEGKFGDPEVNPNKVSKVPKVDAPLRKVDVRELGLAKALSAPAAMQGAIGTIFAGDTGAINSKMAMAMNGDGSELEVGHGTSPFGLKGTGSGGGGDDQLARIVGWQDGPLVDGTDRRALVALAKKPRIGVKHQPLGEPQPTAGCDRGDISKNVRARSASIRACYETQLLAHPDLAGKVTLQWTVGADGHVSGDKTVEDTMGNPVVSDCVLRVLRRIQFAVPEAGVCVVRWPVVFHPG